MSTSPAIPPNPADPLECSRDQFVSLWGQMGSNWGIPRTMAEVHALLFIVGRPMPAEEVMRRLGISRGNVSMTLRALEDWGLVTRQHQRGDRKEYYEAEQDVWKMFRRIIRERKKREIDPVIDALRSCRDATSDSDAGTNVRDDLDGHNQRLDDLIAFMQMVESISQRFVSPSGKGLETAAKLLARAS